jgi:membrane associated rhomboid family serine protease
VGASTAIFGLMGAALVVMRNRGINPMQSGLPLWIGINLILTFTIPGLSKGGHVGGLIGGILAAALLFELPDRVRRLPAAVPLVLTGAVGVAAVAGALAVA